MTIQRSAGVGFVLISLFPWVSFGTNNMDSQPWPLGLALMFLFASMRTPISTRFALTLLFIPAAISVGWWNASQFDFGFYRAIFGYVSVPILLIAYYAYVRKYGFPLPLVKAANVIYLLAAMLQWFLGSATTSWLAPVRTTADRGVPSLALEPTYFGMLLIFLAWIILVCTGYRPRRGNLLLVVANVAFVVFVAKSSMSILFLAIAVAMVILYEFRPALYSGIALSMGLAVAGYGLFLQNTRVGALIDTLQARGLRGLMIADASINIRLAHVVIPWYAAISTLFVPNGFSAFSDAFYASRAWHGGLFWYGADTNAIMSYMGAFLFELGLVGVVFLGYVFSLVFKDSKRRLFELVFLFALLNSALPVSFPLVPLLVVLLYFAGPEGLKARAPDRPHASGGPGGVDPEPAVV